MVGKDDDGAPPAAPSAGLADGALIGKRYSDDEQGLELLVTRGGAGTLAIGETPLALKDAKPLPASD